MNHYCKEYDDYLQCDVGIQTLNSQFELEPTRGENLQRKRCLNNATKFYLIHILYGRSILRRLCDKHRYIKQPGISREQYLTARILLE